jgi:integrase
MIRNQRAGIDDRWTKRVKGPDGKMQTVDSALKGKVKRWRVRWVDETGEEASKSFARKPDAQTFLNKLTADMERGDYISAGSGKELFEAVAEQWYKTKGHRKPSTLSGYDSILRLIALPQWGETPLDKITYEAYIQWLGGLAVNGSQRGTPLSASRIIQSHQLMGAVLKYAVRTGKINKNIALEIDRNEDLPDLVEGERIYLSHAELLELAGAMGRYEIQTLILGYCGPRFGESIALRRRHVGNQELGIYASATNVNGLGIVESTTKTKRNRFVPVPTPIWDQLKSILPSDPDALIFPSYRDPNRFMPIEEYRRAFEKAKTTAGIDARLTPHGLRHTCASLAISAGANIKVVQRLLGHASAAMTLDRYGHLYNDDLTAVGDVLGKAMKATAVSLRSGREKGANGHLLAVVK